VIGEFRGCAFYRGTVGNAIERASVFIIDQHLEELQDGFDMYADGTFSITPLDFKQLFIIIADIEGRPRPLAFVLMNSKTKSLYRHVFSFMHRAFGIMPGQVMLDFEQSSRKAASEVWREASIVGCNFHFCQALKRNAKQREEISALIKESDTAQTTLTMFMRLSLLPPAMIPDGITAIMDYQKKENIHESFHRFNDYFASTWFRKYNISDWCVYGLKHRTNNHNEAYNSMMKAEMQHDPNVYCFLDSLQDLCFKANNDLEEEKVNGFVYKPRSKLTPMLEKSLPMLISGETTIEKFLLFMSGSLKEYML
jgi:MULE transposase domain